MRHDTYFEYRDLGIQEITGGKVLAHVIRAREPCTQGTGYHSHHLDFHMNFCLKGWVRMEFEDLGEVTYRAGDMWYQSPGVKHEVMPADFGTREEQRD